MLGYGPRTTNPTASWTQTPVIWITDSLLYVDERACPEDYCVMVETCVGYAKVLLISCV
jgi:hypothetical protein